MVCSCNDDSLTQSDIQDVSVQVTVAEALPDFEIKEGILSFDSYDDLISFENYFAGKKKKEFFDFEKINNFNSYISSYENELKEFISWGTNGVEEVKDSKQLRALIEKKKNEINYFIPLYEKGSLEITKTSFYYYAINQEYIAKIGELFYGFINGRTFYDQNIDNVRILLEEELRTMRKGESDQKFFSCFRNGYGFSGFFDPNAGVNNFKQYKLTMNNNITYTDLGNGTRLGNITYSLLHEEVVVTTICFYGFCFNITTYPDKNAELSGRYSWHANGINTTVIIDQFTSKVNSSRQFTEPTYLYTQGLSNAVGSSKLVFSIINLECN